MKTDRWCLFACLLLIVGVSAYDSFRCATDSEVLAEIELNPVARCVLDAGGVPLLIGAKSFGVGVVVGILGELWHADYAHRWTVIVAVTFSQALLLGHYAISSLP